MKHAGTPVLCWDLPARVCHWGFAVTLSGALWIGFQTDPESDVFKYHMPLGALAAWFLVVRIALLGIGSPLSRWRALLHRPSKIGEYFGGVIRWRSEEPPGINPGTAIFAPLIWVGAVLLIATGFVADWSERWHGRIAWGVVALIAIHVCGLALHGLRHRSPTALAMVSGVRHEASPEFRARSSRAAAGLALLAVSLALAWASWRHFDVNTCTLRIPFLPEIGFPLIQRG